MTDREERILENKELRTPCYILDEARLIENGKLLQGVQERTGCKILLAQKAFSNYDLYPALAPYLAGTEASGLYEARLGKEEMPGKECHVFCGAYREDEFEELLRYADHIVFNSPNQLQQFGVRAKAAGKEIGLRINPECSTQEGHEIYDPCAPGSRLGTTKAQWDERMTPELIALLDGLHFHTLCEQNSDDLERTLSTFEANFGPYLHNVKWLNMGGGHHITREDYDIPLLEKCILHMKETYNLQIYLEPGEAVALNAGYLCTTVLDIVQNGDYSLAILDMSAACHTPDVIEMPYRPPLRGALPIEHPVFPDRGAGYFSYRLGGPTCLSGDIVGDYCFPKPLKTGDRLLFGDMAIYSTVKNNTFNGMPLPDIWVMHTDAAIRNDNTRGSGAAALGAGATDAADAASTGARGRFERIAHFGYEDFKYRLGSRR